MAHLQYDVLKQEWESKLPPCIQVDLEKSHLEKGYTERCEEQLI